MPLQDHMQIISVDDHLIEHPRVFSDRLPAKYLAEGPRIVEDDKGRHIWHFEDKIFPYIGLNAVAGKTPEQYGLEPLRFDDMIPGCYDPVERVKDMDVDGVQAACCFPSFPGFGGRVFLNATDKDLALACLRAWNDFSIDEWSASAPGRYVPLALLPIWDVDALRDRAEARRRQGRAGGVVPRQPGTARPAVVPQRPLGPALGRLRGHRRGGQPALRVRQLRPRVLGLRQDALAELPWRRLQVGLRPHRRQDAVKDDDDAPTCTSFAVYATNLMWTASDLVFSGQLQKHPRLKFMLAEGGIGWFPYIWERMDQVWARHRYYQPIDFDARPSDLFKKHFWGCYIEDEFGIKNRHEIGIDRICVEIDYPHSDSNWPNSRKQIAESLRDVPDDEAHKIVELNARAVLNFPRL